ncbi:MAG TPA: sigma-70 family RNA polymerase sigma factor [Sedimentisphaerales bacterium]|nr:sigma-70 family RNA polymerase sigma factor [Sedimentisphaerales bacterium]
MENDVDCVRLVKQARLGDTESLERLAALAAESLRENVYRMTLEDELTQDIVQETVLEMLKILGELEEADRFWPWLYRIALNKLRLHRRAQRHRSTAPVSAAGNITDEKAGRDAISEVAARELKQIIFGAMGRLKPEQRAVLTMRCYKKMEHAAIAEAQLFRW